MFSLLLFAALSFAKPAATLDPAQAASASLSAPIPPDPVVHRGTLKNGLQWFVQHNDEPDNRLVLRLVLKVGSVVEDPDQLGLAHLVEHMAFNGTTHFPGNEVVRVMESFGAQFGADVNAHTSWDETVYKLTVPTEDPEALEKAFLILEDWAHGLLLEKSAVDGERGVVLEEWRTRQGPGQRLFDAAAPYQIGPVYSSRMPIGTEESLRTFPQEAIERFVRDWYRPDLMAVIAVGDVDPAWAQAKIEEHFGAIPKAKHARKRPLIDIAPVPGRRVVVLTDPELTSTEVALRRGFDDPERADHAAARDNALDRLMLGVLGERFDARERDADRPFQSAWAQEYRWTPTEGAREVAAETAEGGAMKGLEAVLTEWRRAVVHGLTEPELERARRALIAGVEQSLEQATDSKSEEEAGELIRVFTNGEYYTDLKYELAMYRHFYETITLDEVNAHLRTWMDGDSQLVIVTLPERAGSVIPTEAEVTALVDRAMAAVPEPLPPEVEAGPLVDQPPAGGTVVAEERLDPAIATVHWTLSNGVQVWFKKTDFTPGSVSFNGFSRGGIWGVPESDWIPALAAAELAAQSGVGDHDNDAVRRLLAGRTVSVGTSFTGTTESMQGSARVADLDTMFELLWLKLTDPRFDPEAFDRVKARWTDSVAQRDANPDTAFNDAVTAAMWGDALQFRPWTMTDLDQMNLAASQKVYAERFADLSDATFVFVGDVDEAVLKAQVARWLGALPAAGKKEAEATIPARRLPGQANVTVAAGVEPRATVRISWHGPFQNDYEHRNRLNAVASVAAVLLREALREDLGGVYGVSAWGGNDHRPADAYELVIQFSCDPARKDELIAAALAVVDRLRTTPVDAARIADEREKRTRGMEVQLKENAFWLTSLRNALMYGESMPDLLRWKERIDSVTADGVRADAAAWFTDANRKVVVRMPAEEAK